MRRLALTRRQVHRGPLVLVNRDLPLREDGRSALAPLDGDGRILLDRRAAALLAACLRKLDAARQIVPVSGWRSREEQQRIWDDSLAENGPEFTRQFVAVPGCSEHQTGLAIDLGRAQPDIDFLCPDFPYDGICQRFRLLAPRYGFIERYPAGKEAVTGISHEPWHFRYVGVPHAALMTDMGLTLEEYHRFLTGFPLGGKPLIWRAEGRECLISYLAADGGADTACTVDGDRPCSVSGNNRDGFILTLWREGCA